MPECSTISWLRNYVGILKLDLASELRQGKRLTSGLVHCTLVAAVRTQQEAFMYEEPSTCHDYILVRAANSQYIKMLTVV